MAAPGDDDLMAFLAEVNEAKPAEEGEEGSVAAAAAAGDGGKSSSPSIGAGKRPRAEAEDGAAAAGGEQQQQQQQVVQPAPVVKKAKMVVAKAKPQIFSPQDQEAAAAAAAAAAANIAAGLAHVPGGQVPPGMASPGGMMMGGGDPGAAAGGGGYPTAPPHMGMGMGMGMPPPPPGFPPQAGAGAGAQQHSSGFVTGEAAAAMAGKKPKKFVRVGASKDETWEDPTLNEWPDNDFRLFCGDLGNDVTDEVLANAFRHKYPSFAKAKVIRDKYKGKSKGFGFVSFLDPFEGLKALREMNLKYIGSRPVKLRKSDWKDRNLKEVKKKEKEKKQFLNKLGL